MEFNANYQYHVKKRKHSKKSVSAAGCERGKATHQEYLFQLKHELEAL